MCLVVSSCEIYFSPLFSLAPAHGPVWIYVPTAPCGFMCPAALAQLKAGAVKLLNLIVPTVPLLVLSWEDFYCDLRFGLFLSWKCFVVKDLG